MTARARNERTPKDTLLARVRAELAAVRDPARAPGMQAYMKSAMPYHGVPSPVLKRTLRPLIAGLSFESFESWRAAVLELWQGAAFREERYAALELAKARVSRPHRTLEALPLYEELISTGAWWDVVDDVATHLVRDLLLAEGAPVRRRLLAWSRGQDLWLRRSAIIAQVGARDRVDRELLVDCIRPALDSKEFFLRKAIGWALRDLAWRDPDWVVRYVNEHEAALSGLSKREALKNVEKIAKARKTER